MHLRSCLLGKSTTLLVRIQVMGYDRWLMIVDIWSTGCIFAEMLEGKPLFPGKDRECWRYDIQHGHSPQTLISSLSSPSCLVPHLTMSSRPSPVRT